MRDEYGSPIKVIVADYPQGITQDDIEEFRLLKLVEIIEHEARLECTYQPQPS